MDLSDRRKKILEIVVDNYIKCASPVSSKYISETCLQDVSSATIRNELNVLENMGYLYQPHTSAGRIPSIKAYRTYVDELMKKDPLTTTEVEYVEKQFLNNINSMETLISSSAKIISDLTNYTTVVLPKKPKTDTINALKLIKIDNNSLVLVIVSDKNALQNGMIHIEGGIDEEYIDTASNMLNKIFVGKTFEEAILEENRLIKELEHFKMVIQEVISLLKEYVTASNKLVINGSSKIFEYPEYKDFEMARKFMSVIDSKPKLISLLNNDEDKFNIDVTIGSDSNELLPEGCSIVSANYIINGSNIASAGVLGPTRMSYNKVIAVLEIIGDIIKKLND